MVVKHYQKITLIVLTICFVLLSLNYSAVGAIQKGEDRKEILKKASALQVPFIENQGQIRGEGVKYYAKTLGGTLFITKDGEMVYSLPKFEEGKDAKGWTIKESFVGASISQVKGEEEAITRVSYFKGNDPSKWKRGISTYDLVSLGEIYKGIELKLKAYGNNVEKLFHVKPEANAEGIKVRIEGQQGLRVNEKGELEVETGLGIVKFTKPVAYQEINGKRINVEVAYEIASASPRNDITPDPELSTPQSEIRNSQFVYGFKIGDYDRTKELVIDPLLVSTFLGGTSTPGGNGMEQVYSIAADSSGNLYVAGRTASLDFPTTPGAYDTTRKNGYDGFVSKFDSNLQHLLASTFLTGSGYGYEGPFSIALDSNGNVCVAGYTNSSDFPTTPGGYDTTFNGGDYDVFVSKLDGNLQNLIASTFLGGSDNETDTSLIIDSEGNVFIAGFTSSLNFPTTPGAYDTTFNGGLRDAFVSKFDGNLQNLLVSTFLGGSNWEQAWSIAIDSSGNIFVTGMTSSTDFPITPGAYKTSYSSSFVSKFNSNLQNLLASTFLNGDTGYSITVDSSGNVYVAGRRSGAFISKLDNNLQSLLASTSLNGSDYASSLFVASSGDVYVAGVTESSDFPTTPGAYDTTYNGGRDAFVSRFDSNLQNLGASTYLGGSNDDGTTDPYYLPIIPTIIVKSGYVYVAGVTKSPDFPTTPGAYDTTYDAYEDAFISKLDSNLSAALPDIFPWPMFHHDAQHTGRSPYAGPQENAVLWTYNAGGAVNSSPAIDEDGIIYVGSEDNKLYAINPDGTLKWTYSTGGGIYSSPAIGYDGTIYVGSKDHNVYAINPAGTLKWLYTTGGETSFSPTIGYDGTIYVGSYDGKLYALNPDGTLKWDYYAGGMTPAIGPDGTIYAGFVGMRLHALNPDGTLKWQSDPAQNWPGTAPALSPDGTAVYYGADDGYLYARNTSDGSLKWKSPWTYGGIASSPAIGSDGTVYVGTRYGNLWAINPGDGSLKWNYYMTLSAWSSPAIGADGTIYFATDYGRIYAMNPDGTVKWIYNGNYDNDGHFRSSPAIGSNGTLYIGSTKGKLYAFGKPPCKADFDSDRDVDGSDLAIFAAGGGGDVTLEEFVAEFGRTDCPH